MLKRIKREKVLSLFKKRRKNDIRPPLPQIKEKHGEDTITTREEEM